MFQNLAFNRVSLKVAISYIRFKDLQGHFTFAVHMVSINRTRNSLQWSYHPKKIPEKCRCQCFLKRTLTITLTSMWNLNLQIPCSYDSFGVSQKVLEDGMLFWRIFYQKFNYKLKLFKTYSGGWPNHDLCNGITLQPI